jgi:hypothetical protein
MWKPPASILACCVAALPLIGCAGSLTAPPPQAGVPPAAVAATLLGQGTYTTQDAVPAAVVVFLPGAVAIGDVLTRDPALWTAQGLDVVMPRPAWTNRLIADQQAAVERLLASAQALANAPIWLVGPSSAIEAAMPRLGPAEVSGIVVTSVTSNSGSCSRTMYYSSPGSGSEPKVVVKTSGDACGTSPSFGARQAPPAVVPAPGRQPNASRIIETSIPTDHAAQMTSVQRIAEEIKSPQPES